MYITDKTERASERAKRGAVRESNPQDLGRPLPAHTYSRL
jgi:hypothetical protein